MRMNFKISSLFLSIQYNMKIIGNIKPATQPRRIRKIESIGGLDDEIEE